jgi:acetyltransferase-like isoleucine patch superfamily enzyme
MATTEPDFISPRTNSDSGLRRFDAKNITPRFEFGFGGSYTTFEYSNITIGQTSSIEHRFFLNASSSLYDSAYTVSFTVANTGSLDGHEVSQLYLGFPDTVGEPLKSLRGDWMHSECRSWRV